MTDEPTSSDDASTSEPVPQPQQQDSAEQPQTTSESVPQQQQQEGEEKQLQTMMEDKQQAEAQEFSSAQPQTDEVTEDQHTAEESGAEQATEAAEDTAGTAEEQQPQLEKQSDDADTASEQQTPPTEAASDASIQQTESSDAASQAATDTTEQQQELAAESPAADANGQPVATPADATEGDNAASNAATILDTVPPSDSQLTSSQPTSTDNIDNDSASILLQSAQLPSTVSDSSTQLIATLPAACNPPPAQPAPIPREATIHVRMLLSSAEEPVTVSVHIVREYLNAPKPFLGGYRHHVSGRVKHHASVQTDRRQTGKGAGRERATRDTQTVETATRSAQSGRSVGTQMARKDYYIGEEGETGQGERVVMPGEYVDSAVLEAQREERAKQIQCWLRVCFAVRRMKQLKAAKDDKESSERQATEAAADRRRREEEQQIHRRMHPKSAADFQLLYAELNAWRQHEAARIHTLELSDDERDRQLSSLLSKEVKLLQTIDRLKIRAGAERKEEHIHRRLEMMQSPKEWTTSAGHHVEVVTPYTVRAQELTSLYQALLLPVQMHAEEKEAESESPSSSGCLSWEGRVDVLLHCKYVVGEMASQLSTDILQLIEREQEWVRRRHATPGWHADQALAGMRKRLAALFLQFVQTPAYNPEAAVYVDSVGREGKQKMQELLKKPLAEREMRRGRPAEVGQDRILIAHVQT